MILFMPQKDYCGYHGETEVLVEKSRSITVISAGDDGGSN